MLMPIRSAGYFQHRLNRLPRIPFVLALLLLQMGMLGCQPDTTGECNPRPLNDRDCDGYRSEVDCDDADPLKGPIYVDVDADGHGAPGQTVPACDRSSGTGFSEVQDDCNDERADIFAGASELCDGIDNDCDGQVDEDLDSLTWYYDQDQDGYGASGTATTSCIAPASGEWVSSSDDCDDSDASIHPGAAEVCDGLDNDCKKGVDDGLKLETFYADADGDETGALEVTQVACAAPDGYIADASDCNDSDSTIYPKADELCDGLDNDCDGTKDDGLTFTPRFPDGDGDGYGTDSGSITDCEATEGYVLQGGDCDDTSSRVHPGAEEICDPFDNDCVPGNGGIIAIWYPDEDEDSFGDANQPLEACAEPEGYVSDASDCDDGEATVNPEETELCDDLDNDCNGLEDDGLTFLTYWPDADDDGYGEIGSSSFKACSTPLYASTMSGDCDGANDQVYPSAIEQCDGLDNDCNDKIDDNVAYFDQWIDKDGDGFGNAAAGLADCIVRSGYVLNSKDCDDAQATVYPGAPEACNGKDEDCDGAADNGLTFVIWYPDGDADGSGDLTRPTSPLCKSPGAGYTTVGKDCDDSKAFVYPNAFDVIGDGIDADCDGFQEVLTRVAGVGYFNGDGHMAIDTSFYNPTDILVDGDYIYIADSANYRVRQIAPDGRVSTIAGTGVKGDSGDASPATNARFNSTEALAMDPNGNLLVTDSASHRVRKILRVADGKWGNIVKYAGNGASGYSGDNGPATYAQLKSPLGIAVDTAGQLFIADNGNDRIRRVNANGIIETVAGYGPASQSADPNFNGDGVATATQINNPSYLAMGPDGALYFSDSYNNRIRKLENGAITTVAGGGDTVPADNVYINVATSASLGATTGLAFSQDGALYFSDYSSSRVRVIDNLGGLTTVVGVDPAQGSTATFNYPLALALDGTGTLLVCEVVSSRVRAVDPASNIFTRAGTGSRGYSGDGSPASDALLNMPRGTALDASGNLLIADYGNACVRKVASDGTISTVVTAVRGATDIAVSPDGAFFVSAEDDHVIYQVKSGKKTVYAGVLGQAGYSGEGGQATMTNLSSPWGVALDSSGNLYIGDSLNARVRRVDASTHTVSTWAGGGSAVPVDGAAATSTFLPAPKDVACDAADNLFIVDYGRGTEPRIVRVARADGTIKLIAGGGSDATGDCIPATSMNIGQPYGVAIDQAGNVFFAREETNRILRIDLTGTACGVIGDGLHSSVDPYLSPAASTSLNGTRALFMAPDGVMYISDSGNSRVLRLEP